MFFEHHKNQGFAVSSITNKTIHCIKIYISAEYAFFSLKHISSLREKMKLLGNVSQKIKHKLKETRIYFQFIRPSSGVQ
jgi:hypothetical protein